MCLSEMGRQTGNNRSDYSNALSVTVAKPTHGCLSVTLWGFVASTSLVYGWEMHLGGPVSNTAKDANF